MFSKEELERYSRHFVLPGFGEGAQKQLKKSSVLVVGAGGLGAPLLQYLTAAGVGKIGIIDFDLVELSNLQRQVLFNTSDTGKHKAEISVQRLQQLNPYVEFKVYKERLTSHNALAIIDNYNVVADGSDNFPTRYLVNDACVIANKPLVYGSIHAFEGQCSVLNYQQGPNYRDIHPNPPDPESVPNCAEGGVLGALAGIIGSTMAVEAIKLAAGLKPGLAGKLFLFDSQHYYNDVINLGAPNPQNRLTQLVDYEAFCSGQSTHEENSPKSVSAYELKTWLNENKEGVELVDVREIFERAIGHIGGIHIPLSSIASRSNEIPKKGKVVFYCSGGVRSAHAIEQLASHSNYKNFYNLEGGLYEWRAI